MKIVTDTPDLLILEDTPWGWGLVMIALSLSCLAGGLFIVFQQGEWGGWILILQTPVWLALASFVIRRTQAVFNAAEAWVELRRRSVFGYRAIRHDLSEIARAEVDTVNATDNETRRRYKTHRPILVIEGGQSQGKHPILALHREGDSAATTANLINRWLDSYHARA